MSNKTSQIILAAVVVLFLVGGVLFIIFRQPIAVSLQPPITLPATSTFTTTAGDLDTEILRSPRLAKLVAAVRDFDFDRLCFRPESALSRLGLGAETSTVPACVLGNNLPFRQTEQAAP